MSRFTVAITVTASKLETGEHAALMSLSESFDLIVSLANQEAFNTVTEMYANTIMEGRMIAVLGPPKITLTKLDNQTVFDEASELLANINVASVIINGTYAPAATTPAVETQQVIPDFKHTPETPATIEEKLPPAVSSNNPSFLIDQLKGNPKFAKILNSVCLVLSEKDKLYGNVAHKPLSIFEGKLAVGKRIDDKLARIINNPGELRKNDVFDVIGYLVLGCVEKGWDDFSDQLD